jgi:hypothetical protein
MKKNRKNSTLFNSMWRPLRFGEYGSTQRIVIGVVSFVFLTALAIGCSCAYLRLRDAWESQCVLLDYTRQVHVSGCSKVPVDVLLRKLSLTNGVNLARIDFAARREKILEDYPELRTISVERRMPDHVLVTVEERIPIARIDVKDGNQPGRVVDTAGVVFRRIPGTKILPCIRERKTALSQKGTRLTGRLLAALKLVCMCAESEFADMRLAEVDATHQDYLVATLGNSATVKIKWEGMDDSSPTSQAYLRKTLQNVHHVLTSRLDGGAMSFNATVPNKVFADTKDPIK